MKRIVSCILCVLICFTIPVMAFADSDYSYISNRGVELEYPAADNYYSIPQYATVKSTKPNGSIYFMPTPKDGNGVLGTVANGTEVTILAEKSGFFFFSTADGRMGWNGKKFFTVSGPAGPGPAMPGPVLPGPPAPGPAAPGSAPYGPSAPGPAPKNSNVFTFESGASVMLPLSFYSTGVERDRNNAYVSSFFTDFDQSMDLTLTEIDTTMYYQRGTAFMNSLYSSLKDDYPKPTYDAKKADKFDLSGYTGDSIYYFKGVLSNQIMYLIKMFYPTRNRNVCDRYVERITESFTTIPDNAPWFMPAPYPSSVRIPINPTSPYAKALKENLVNGISYTNQQKKDVVNETYYGRKNAKGERQAWYTSSSYDDPNTGYRIGFYYADGLVFFADAYHVGQRSEVTFYFWGDQLLCVHDLRYGDKQLRFAGSDTYDAIVREFGDLYAKALQYAN